MGRNLDRGLENRVEKQRPEDRTSSGKVDKVRRETSKELYDNLKR